jgi:transcriptional regulator with XRE-family HTH domain
MSTAEHIGHDVPEWTLGWRLQRARDHRGLTQQQLATELQIGLRQIKEAEAGKKRPGRATLIGWAFVCGVDTRWLESGVTGIDDGGHTIRYLYADAA